MNTSLLITIFKQIYMTHGTLTGTITQFQNGSKGTGNEGELHTPQSSRTPDAV